MPTIKNRKKEPLSIEALKEKFNGSYGIKVLEYQDGIARIASLSDGLGSVQWWVDVKDLVSDSNISLRQLSTILNKQIPNRKEAFYAY